MQDLLNECVAKCVASEVYDFTWEYQYCPKLGEKFCENQIGYREKCVNSMDGPPLCCQRSVNFTLYFRFHIGPLFLCWFLDVDPFNT